MSVRSSLFLWQLGPITSLPRRSVAERRRGARGQPMDVHLPGSYEIGKRPTMRDVAAVADVSLKTGSRVVNGEPGVSGTLVQRVRHAIDELDFRPNIGASSLRRTGGRTATVGL